MKRAAFVAVAAATTLPVAAVAQLAVVATPDTLRGKQIFTTEWQQALGALIWFKRWYMLNVFSDEGYGHGPHLTTARLVTVSQWHAPSFNRDGSNLDAYLELQHYLNGGQINSPNTCRFRDGDILPCSIE